MRLWGGRLAYETNAAAAGKSKFAQTNNGRGEYMDGAKVVHRAGQGDS